MARGKKKESALTPEEKLAQALVPDWEQPYKVPRNWCWVRLGSLGYTNIGLTYKPANISATGTIVLRSSNIQNGQMDYSDIVSVEMDIPESKMSKKGDILICARNGSKALVGKTAIIDRDGMSYGAFMAIFRSPYNSLIYHYLNSHYFRDIIDHDVGTTTINQITQSLIKELPFPLPPFAEQQRIVDRIEYLFAKLDEAKEKAQSVLDSFETRKAAILHKAFTGELTAKWRAEHGVRLENWKRTRFDVVAEIKSNLVDPADYQNFPHIAPDNIEKKTGVLLEYHTIAEDGVTSGKHRFYPGQILYSKIRPYLSKLVVVDFDGLCSADMYPIEAKKDARCLWYYMMSEEFLEQASSAGSRSVLPKINQKELSALMVSLPTDIEEQKEIVRILDSLFAKEQQAKEAAEAVLEKIDLLKKSILARAFRGELGTNDPTEESALELLKQVLQ